MFVRKENQKTGEVIVSDTMVGIQSWIVHYCARSLHITMGILVNRDYTMKQYGNWYLFIGNNHKVN